MTVLIDNVAASYRRFLDDRWNPILVKEVRQALRGRFFRVAFLCTLVAVTLASTAMILHMNADVAARESREYFVGVYFCLTIAVVGLVPFQAFTAMGAEWDENTYDLLVLSRMRPRQIVAGKFLSSLAQTILFFSAFTPFLVFPFLLQQIDLLAVVVLLVGVFLASILLTTVALFLSTLSRVRFVRVILMAALGGLLVLIIGPSGEIADAMLRHSADLADPEGIAVLSGLAVGGLLVMAYALLSAANLLAHPEENRSTNVRVLTTLTTLIAIGFSAWLLVYLGSGRGSPDRAGVIGIGAVLLIGISLPAIFFTTEFDALGRRVTPRVPRRIGFSLAAYPFLPGGARGAVLWLLLAGLVTLFVLVGQSYYAAGPRGFLDDGMASYGLLLTYLGIVLLLPSGLFAPYTHVGQVRAAARVTVPFLVVVFAFVPAMIGFFLDDSQLMRAAHPGNPFYFMAEAGQQDPRLLSTQFQFLGALLVVALLINLPRLLASVRELLDARRLRLAREAEAGAA